ncbi:MAG: methionine adenosyltransferase [Candidatus Woykebacteria bacterium RIFCSPLOWO2_01_FULL_41_12]|uniref:Methionine adenosyltransferase n=1 Tax=Candidatus Woykebacteria bacterium RIFCSPLOWO2_01_FULL_41_12 TaxID=1802604 RepID=A0A1G1WVS6_9BACT|nr:MAG: methionine adenosyltransferase [Candidatus Woykebacteria bacterium RIFCSPLOWO2_01_FULL_41_12]
MNYKLFTSESVAAGHPDKICDQISDAILDAALEKYPNSHTGIETLVTTNHVTLAGEVKVKHGVKLDYEKIARDVIEDLGYTNPKFGFDYKAKINTLIHQQSTEIAQGVDAGGAGDQGMMFGFATNETKNFMPTPIAIAHKLVQGLDHLRESKKLPYLFPDGKSEVTVFYENGKPKTVDKVVLAVAAHPKASVSQVKADLFKLLVKPTLANFWFALREGDFLLNGTGWKWTTPGPASDTGVTGRKIIVDTYGGFARVGGGCFSGKDPTKVDRSAAYAARYIAKNIVAQGLADKAEVQIAYVIGQRYPIAKDIETFGTEKKSRKVIEDFAWNILDLSVSGILVGLDLLKPIYRKTAAYGHFGKDNLPWEKLENY